MQTGSDAGDTAAPPMAPLEPPTPLAWWRSGPTYLSLLVAALPASILTHYLWPDLPIIKGQAPAIAIPWLMAGLALLAWLGFRPSRRLPVAAITYLGLTIALWAFVFVQSRVDGYPTTYLQYLLPLGLAMVLIKPPGFSDAKCSADVMSWCLVATAVISEANALVFGRPPHTVIPVHWGLISDIFGITERWYGPFTYPSFAGMVGCFLAVYGLTRRRIPGIVFMLVGGIIMLVSGQNTAVLAAVLGALALFVFSRFPRRLGEGIGRRLAIAGGILAVLGGFALWQNQTLSGRTPLYPIFLDFWRSSPLTGIGSSGIAVEVAAGRVPQSLTSSHNVAIDLLARFGLIGFLLGTGILVAAIWATLRPARRGRPAGFAIVMTFLTIGLAEYPTDWLYWSVPTIYLLLGVLLAADRPPRHPGQEAGSPASSS